MGFTSLTDFQIVPYVIPTQQENADGVLLFLNNQERTELEELLGKSFYNALVAGTAALPADWVETTDYALDAKVVYGKDIYKSLQNPNAGKIPTNEPTYWEIQPVDKWLRLKLGDVYENQNQFENTWVGLVEMLRPCLHAMYLRDYSSHTGGVGVMVANVENSNNVPPEFLISRHYSEYNRIASSCEDSLISYLRSNSELFDDEVNTKGYRDFKHYLDVNFAAPGSMNAYGL